MKVLGCILLCAQLLSYSRGLTILSFNVRQFGVTKYGKQNVVDVLIKVEDRACVHVFYDSGVHDNLRD